MEREYLNTKENLFDENTKITEDMNGKFFYFKCKECNAISSKGIYYRHHILQMFSLNCTKCNRKLTNLKKFGCENPFQNENIKKKIKNTTLERYGVENVNKLEHIRQKIESKRKERYGEHKELIVEKSKQTFLKNFGVDNPQKNEVIRQKTVNTCIDKYGGIPNCFGTEQFYESMEKKYGKKHALQVRDFRLKAISRYKYNGIYFDSSWELCVYIYLKDNGVDFEYHPFKEELVYKYEDKIHHYTPDFRIENSYIEIKGPQFIKNNELCNPYQNVVYYGLKSIIESLGVVFWTKNDIKFHIDYVKYKYGPYYVKNFKATN